MALINMMESFVAARLDELLRDYDCCKCESCREDMMAIALNDLPPRYVSTPKGQLFTRAGALLQQNAVDIEVALLKAIAMVGAKPRHDAASREV